jgi:hypothetical protein
MTEETPRVESVPETPFHDPEAVRYQARPLSRVWVYGWTILTWISAFTILVVYLDVNVKDTPSKRYVRTFTSMNKVSHPNLQKVSELYTDEGNAYAAADTPTARNAKSVALLDNVMLNLNCHAGPTSGGATGALPGGLSVAPTSLDPVSSTSFEFASHLCMCVYKKHNPAQTGNVGFHYEILNAAAEADFKDFVTTYVRQLGIECGMGTRATHTIEVGYDGFLSVSPFLIVVYVNGLAVMFSVLYMITGNAVVAKKKEDKASREEGKDGSTITTNAWTWIENFTSNKIYVVIVMAVVSAVFLVLIIALSKDPSDGEKVLVSVFFIVALIIAGSLVIWGWNTKSKDDEKTATSIPGEDVMVTQRMAFWIQYIFTAPLVVMAGDVIAQQRFNDFLIPRFLFSIALVLLAMGYDGIYLFSTFIVTCMQDLAARSWTKSATYFYDPKTKKTNYNELETLYHYTVDDNLRSATWWAWGTWLLGGAILLHGAVPTNLSWAATDLVMGWNTVIATGVAVYILGVPLACIPGMAERNSEADGWKANKHETALALRLSVELVARMLITLGVLFWVVE